VGAVVSTPSFTGIGNGFVARVGGVDLRHRPDDASVDALREAFLDHKVLVFDPQCLAVEELCELAACFGEVLPAPRELVHKDLTRAVHDCVVQVVHEGASPGSPDNFWHSDSTNHAQPEMGGLLSAVELPPYGGDTVFADMCAAYDGLGDGMKALVGSLRAVHDIAVMTRPTRPSAERLAELHRTYPPVDHPVVRTHPVTGRRAIYVNTVWTSHILGLDRRESDELLHLLFRQAEKPEYQYRHRWQPGEIVVWDNRVVQHYAVADYGPHHRVMHRLSLRGDTPA
jgi:taurine dioxygenase